MIGTLLNALGIGAGGIVGLVVRRNLKPDTQQHARTLFTALTVATAAYVTWQGLTGPLANVLKQMIIAGLSLSVGSLMGHLLGLQSSLSRLVRWAEGAKGKSSIATPDSTTFATRAVVFAANPLGLLGAGVEGVSGNWQILALKAGLDALAAWGFVAAGNRDVLLTILPLAAVQGTITLLTGALSERFLTPPLVASVQVMGGVLVLVLAPVVFGWRKVPLANYLPALVLAPLLTAWWR